MNEVVSCVDCKLESFNIKEIDEMSMKSVCISSDQIREIKQARKNKNIEWT